MSDDKIKRNQHGWPYIINEAGEEELYIRTSKLANLLDNSYALDQWHNRLTAVGLADNQWMLTDVHNYRNQPQELNEIVKAAQRKAGSDKKSSWGTVIHWFTECIDNDVPIIPEQAPDKVKQEASWYGATVAEMLDLAEDDLIAYEWATQHLSTVLKEQFLVCDELKSAGSADTIAYDAKVDKKRIVDLKTGRIDLSSLKFSMQMGIYSRSLIYEPPDAPWEPAYRAPIENLDLKWGLVIHLPMQAGDCQIYRVPLDKGYEAAAFASELRDLRSVSKKWMLTYDAPDPVEVPEIPEDVKTIADMKDFAKKYNVPLKGATKKDDIRAVLEEAERKVFE